MIKKWQYPISILLRVRKPRSLMVSSLTIMENQDKGEIRIYLGRNSCANRTRRKNSRIRLPDRRAVFKFISQTIIARDQVRSFKMCSCTSESCPIRQRRTFMDVNRVIGAQQKWRYVEQSILLQNSCDDSGLIVHWYCDLMQSVGFEFSYIHGTRNGNAAD